MLDLLYDVAEAAVTIPNKSQSWAQVFNSCWTELKKEINQLDVEPDMSSCQLDLDITSVIVHHSLH